MPYRIELPPVTVPLEFFRANYTGVSPISEKPVRPVRSGETPNTGFEKDLPACVCLAVTERKEVPYPVHLTPWLIVCDASRFIEATLADLAVYVAAKNKGEARHWMENLLEEKLEHLRLCGIEVEIMEVH